jgi:hypothetical protein
MTLFEQVRDKFESWATEHGFNLTRHPNDNDFYFNKEVSMLFVCFADGFALGCNTQMDRIEKEFNSWSEATPAQVALIERALDDE